jgi:hypothetical protein
VAIDGPRREKARGHALTILGMTSARQRRNVRVMEPYLVTVIDGPVSVEAMKNADQETLPETDPQLQPVLHELMRREPIFHREEFGVKREDFEKMTAPEFREIGASGRRYGRRFVLDALETRYENATHVVWEIRDFHCQQIAPGNYLVTYTLSQGERVTRRATIWRRAAEGWQIVYHQGTMVEGAK